MKRFLMLICFALTIICVQAKPKKANFYYMFFSPEREMVVEDSLLRISLGIDPNCQYYRDLDRHLNNNPLIVLELENKSEDIVYIDLARSFINRNKKSQMFWDNTQVINSSGTSGAAAVNLGAVANATGIGGVIGALAQGITIGGGKSSSTTTITQSERILRLPPFSTETITMPLNYNDAIENLGFRTAWNFKWCGESYFLINEMNVGDKETWTTKDSPMTFRVFVTYSDSEQFDKELKKNIFIYCDTLIGPREWIGSKESTKEIHDLGYPLDKPYIMLKRE